LELRRRAERLLKLFEGRPHPNPEWRCAALLEQIGSADARQLLRKLAGGWPQARLTQEAKRALERLERRGHAREPKPAPGSAR
jgi:hypothetical protein